MMLTNWSAEVISDFKDPLLDTYHVDGAEGPEELEALRAQPKRHKVRAKRTLLTKRS